MKHIVTCGCGDTDDYAVAAFKILFPKERVPKVVSQAREDVTFGKWTPYIQAARKLEEEKYAYYLTDDEMWDLLEGERIA